jgi:hypothetical protein
LQLRLVLGRFQHGYRLAGESPQRAVTILTENCSR